MTQITKEFKTFPLEYSLKKLELYKYSKEPKDSFNLNKNTQTLTTQYFTVIPNKDLDDSIKDYIISKFINFNNFMRSNKLKQDPNNVNYSQILNFYEDSYITNTYFNITLHKAFNQYENQELQLIIAEIKYTIKNYLERKY